MRSRVQGALVGLHVLQEARWSTVGPAQSSVSPVSLPNRSESGELFGDQGVVAGLGAFPGGVQGVSQVGMRAHLAYTNSGLWSSRAWVGVVDGFGFAQQRQTVASPSDQIVMLQRLSGGGVVAVGQWKVLGVVEAGVGLRRGHRDGACISVRAAVSQQRMSGGNDGVQAGSSSRASASAGLPMSASSTGLLAQCVEHRNSGVSSASWRRAAEPGRNAARPARVAAVLEVAFAILGQRGCIGDDAGPTAGDRG